MAARDAMDAMDEMGAVGAMDARGAMVSVMSVVERSLDTPAPAPVLEVVLAEGDEVLQEDPQTDQKSPATLACHVLVDDPLPRRC